MGTTLEVANIISHIPSVGFVYLLLQGKSYYLYQAILFLLVAISTGKIKDFLKPYMKAHPWLKRPDHARDCDLMNKGGACGDACGFPSGHMSLTTFLLTPFWLNKKMTTPVFAGLVSLVGWARWVKGCHNIPQIFAGILYGSTLGYAFSKVFKATR
jgi:membrane-associated phospholipid phosphatase